MPVNTPLFLDCDTGIDDALALGYLLRTPNIDLRGIGTVSGNISAAEAALNTASLLRILDRDDIPVAIGEHDPRRGSYAGGAPEVHGVNGIGDVTLPRGRQPSAEPAPELLIRLAREADRRGEQLDVLAIGPLTNIARAVELAPELPQLVGRLTVMGGAVHVSGNITPAAEANIFNDPESARLVLRAGFRTTLVPLDVTHHHYFDDEDAADLTADGTPLARALGAMLCCYIDYYESVLGRRRSPLHDPLAAAIASAEVAPTVVEDSSIDVLVTGPERGRTIIAEDESVATTRVILGAAPEAAALIKQRILRTRMECAA
ncbi:nucleoside hydrolase [Microbacterium mangrovi]|uniref:nucleoside hydrolase n=1 Tax=Microbacterium mangrovi TaxID=1348253 RepID=UPI0009DE1C79|nr:nucleoside hydrolase [Microbacterium mangrovi]